jgi:redox-sensitive bicupin YhaK (pirin superfamily)
MSGPVTTADAVLGQDVAEPPTATVEISESREAQVGGFRVRRALPRRGRRTVGPWCFVDHMGPATVDPQRGLDVAPHPHIGLQTVTWLLAGEALHRDSLGTEQVIVPGQLNLMTAGHGVAHSEEGTGRFGGVVHGVQLWVAQPSATRDGPAAFEHHGDLPQVAVDRSTATVLVGRFAGAASPARRDSDHVGIDLRLGDGATTMPLRPDFEHAFIVLNGAVLVDGHAVEPGRLAYLGPGRDECRFATREPAQALLLGGVPFEERLLMWWNFVARTQEELTAAYRAWTGAGERFGQVRSPLPRVDVGPPPWARDG